MDDAIRCAIASAGTEALSPALALEHVSDPAFGGQALFVGRVRNHSDGRPSTAVHYDLFESLALAQFQRIAQDVIDRHGPGLRVSIVHAKGLLQIGDIAVVVAAGSAHRDTAFRACRELIEAVSLHPMMGTYLTSIRNRKADPRTGTFVVKLRLAAAPDDSAVLFTSYDVDTSELMYVERFQ